MIFLCLLRFLIMGVLKSKDIGEHIHVEGLEFVSQFFQGHSLLLRCVQPSPGLAGYCGGESINCDF